MLRQNVSASHNIPYRFKVYSDSDSCGKILQVGIKVTNADAEQGVALIREYNRLFTQDEHYLQYLFQVVAKHRQRFQNSRKSILLGCK